jgi:hypothetical protein
MGVMAHRRDRSLGAGTVVGPKIALTRGSEKRNAPESIFIGIDIAKQTLTLPLA